MFVKRTYCLLLFFLLFNLKGVFAQKLYLNLVSKDSINNTFLQQFYTNDSLKNHKEVENKLNLVTQQLKNQGYFLNTIDSIQQQDSIYTAYFSLGKKVNHASIEIPQEINNIASLKNNSNILYLKIEKLTPFLHSTSTKLDKAGYSFSKLQLKPIIINNDTLKAKLNLNRAQQRYINKVVIKGYKSFPKEFLKHKLKINQRTLFSKDKLEAISNDLKTLDFITETRAPEVLFSKDSTIVYLYLKKKNNNSFDGLLNFNSDDDNNGIVFNGHVNINFSNILNTGEKLSINWIANGNDQQNFKLYGNIPYIFNTHFTPEVSLNIHRQDSTFLSTNFKSKLKYNITQHTTLGLSYTSETSSNTLENTTNTNIKDYSNSFAGVYLAYNRKKFWFNTSDFIFKANPQFGKRDNTSQFKVNIESSIIFNINNRNNFYIRNHSFYLRSNNYLTNELYRTGGLNSFRGVPPLSLLSYKFSYFNTEYRFTTSQTSYLYSIADFGRFYQPNNSYQQLTSLGLGFSFTRKSLQSSISFTRELNGSSMLNIVSKILF